MKKRESAYNLHNLSKRIISIIIIVSFTPMILVIGILLFQFRSSYHEKTHDHLRELVEKHKQNIDTFLNEKTGNIRFLLKNYIDDDFETEKKLQTMLTALQNEYGYVFVDLGIVDQSGIQVLYAGPYKFKNVIYSDADWFKEAVKKDFYISNVFSGLRGYPHFIITVTRKEKGNNLLLLRATIDFGAFNLLVENLCVGQTGHAFILNRKGEYQTKPSKTLCSYQENYSYFFKRLEQTKKKGVLIEEKQNEFGEKLIIAASLLNHGDWLMIFRQEKADAFSALLRMQIIAGVIFLLGGFSIVMMAFIFSRKVVDRIIKTDKEMKLMNEQVVESGKLASVGELAAGIAHEINNPVAIMVEEAGWIEDLMEENYGSMEDREEIERALKQINVQGKRCKEITHKLLSFARKTDSTIKDVQINQLVKEIVGLSMQIAKYNKVIIETELQKNLPLIRISPAEIQQVLLNMINNAQYAMERNGGKISILTKMSKIEDDHIVIVVEDNGPGIPKVNLGRIFNPFFTTKPVGKGTGLGLSICYGIIQKMGGKIDVISIIGKGTKFRISIPYIKTKN